MPDWPDECVMPAILRRVSTAGGVSRESAQRGGLQLKDQWDLAEDGQFLKVDRSVHSQGASGTVHLVFRKQQADSTRATAQDHAN